MYFQNKYVKPQYINSNNKVHIYSSFKEIMHNNVIKGTTYYKHSKNRNKTITVP